MRDLTIQKIRDMVGADYDCVYELNARTKDELGDMIRFLVGYIEEAEKGFKRDTRNLTEHQKAVEEAAGMPLDWGMAAAYEAGEKS